MLLEEEERVLWRGKPRMGIARSSAGRIATGWIALLLLSLSSGVVLVLVGSATRAHAAWYEYYLTSCSLALAGTTCLIILATFSKYVQVHLVPCAVILLVVPCLSIPTATRALTLGISECFFLLGLEGYWVCVFAGGLAASKMAWDLNARLSTHYILTSRRALEVRVGFRAARLIWSLAIHSAAVELEPVFAFSRPRRASLHVRSGGLQRVFRNVDNTELLSGALVSLGVAVSGSPVPVE